MARRIAVPLQLFGLAVLAGGVALIWPAAGVIVAGLGLFGVGVMLDNARPRP